MSHYEDAINKLCKFSFVFSNIDTVFIDSMSNVKFEFGYTQVPEPLKTHFGNMYDDLNLQDKNYENDVIIHSNSYMINFVSARISDKNGFIGNIVVGPYLTDEPSDTMIQDIILENNISLSLRHIIKQYYLSLPMINTYKSKAIAEFLAYFTSNIHTANSQSANIGEIKYTFKSEHTGISNTINKDTEISIPLTEKRYSTESKLMHLIETGDKEQLIKLNNEEMAIFNKIPDRIPNDPLRSRKNLAFVLNTLLRIAARNGGLHPIHIHSLSEKYAIQIERTSSIQQLKGLMNDMPLTYCDAVRKFSLKEFPHIIRESIEFIRLNLNSELNLDIISDAVNISSYELSRQFKKDTGMSITEFINKLRINESIYLIENQNISITDIAQMVGFNDVNYFTKVFKKINGVTPSEYRKTNK